MKSISITFIIFHIIKAKQETFRKWVFWSKENYRILYRPKSKLHSISNSTFEDSFTCSQHEQVMITKSVNDPSLFLRIYSLNTFLKQTFELFSWTACQCHNQNKRNLSAIIKYMCHENKCTFTHIVACIL